MDGGTADQYVVNAAFHLIFIDATAHSGVTLGVEVYQQHALLHGSQRGGQIDAARGLANTAFLVRDCDNSGQ
jgi:hypothetical protein